MGIKLNTAKQAFPMIYAYSTPQIADHNGWTKIGYTEEQDVETRIKQQTHTSDTLAKLEWKGAAIFDDGSGESFTDKAFHAYLRKLGVANKARTEWFHIDGPTGRRRFYDFRADRGILKALDVIPYELRAEQEKAVGNTVAYYDKHDGGEYLWNAKPRFGKTLSVYDFCKRVQARSVLIVTNRPAIANSWYTDYTQFMGEQSGFRFISETDSLKGKPYVLSREEWMKCDKTGVKGYIQFVSLQDLKGSVYFGGHFKKLKEIKDTEWSVLVIDEAHEGVDTLKTDAAFDQIKRKFTLHLSGTPFKALANDKFPDGAIFNWTYAEEQAAKRDWDDAKGDNPYASLPRLNLYTYQMSEIVKDEISRGIEIDGETEEYAFDLNEFFETKNSKFVHNESVNKFLDALTTQTKFPFSTDELRHELKHTFWLLNRVDSAKALAIKLKEHPVFSQYEIIVAAGDGKLDDSDETQKSFDKVREAIANHDRIPVTPNTKDELNINPETGDVEIPQEQVIGMAKDMFGDKIYATVEDGTLDTQIKSAFDDAAAKSQDAAQSAFDDFKEKFKSETVKSIIGIAKEKYQENIRVSDAKALEKGLNSQFDRAANKVYNSYQIEQNTAESDRLDALRSRHETGKSEAEIEAEFEQKKKELQDSLQEQLSDAVKSFIETSTQSVVETTEKKIKEREKAGIEDSVRDHLRGFSRTIPSFLMAYGDDTVTLATFDAVIPNPVFLEVTSITLDQFRFLRDGGKYTDAETGEERDFAGNLFDPVVFDDSVKEFLRLKKKLADYFDEKSIEDIFDYIPPQKTNQIFTPKTMVKKMVDMLEAENPGCFDDPDKTFIDLYMKSGLYITEIVKRLYQSEQMKKQFPDPKERLRHIFEKQVYGLAPTEIIYHIALSYILGFNNEDTKDIKHNFRQLDALPYAKEGTLQQKLDELFS